MKRPTARPLTPAELDRLFTEGAAAPPEQETAVKRWTGKNGVVGEREAEARRVRDERAARDRG